MATNGNYPMKPPARPQASIPPKTAQIKGEAYPVLNLQGKPYAPVHQRVESAHKHGGYTVISCEFKEVFEMRVCEVWIEIDGKRYPGTAELKKNFDRPLEDAQTSAIGRALAFAGYNIDTAIASHEDMEGVMQEQQVRIVESAPALPEPAPSDEQMNVLDTLCTALGRERPAPDVLTAKQADALIRQMMGEQCAKLGHDLKLSGDEYRTIVRSYTHEGKVSWGSVKSALQTKLAEASLPTGA